MPSVCSFCAGKWSSQALRFADAQEGPLSRLLSAFEALRPRGLPGPVFLTSASVRADAVAAALRVGLVQERRVGQLPAHVRQAFPRALAGRLEPPLLLLLLETP